MKIALMALALVAAVVVAGSTHAILGDVNGDGKVDMRDVAVVAKSFGATVSDPRYNAVADLNSDGFINMMDIALVASNLGK